MRVWANAVAPRYARLMKASTNATTQICFTKRSPVLNHYISAAHGCVRWSSSSSSSRWKQRQEDDKQSHNAKVRGLKSRAAFKLLEMDAKYRLFRKGQTVVDLGYAPGSWSQVAAERTKPNGYVLGIDLIPAQPPKGVSTIQGNFLSPFVQKMVKDYLFEFTRRRGKSDPLAETTEGEEGVVTEKLSYIDAERAESVDFDHETNSHDEKLVDVLLSDMLMNTSGMKFRDHAGSMDLCQAALQFASETLRTGGHFVCKFYQGAEDKAFEMKLKKMFTKVHREKPPSSRDESREGYFVALRRKGDVPL